MKIKTEIELTPEELKELLPFDPQTISTEMTKQYNQMWMDLMVKNNPFLNSKKT